MEDSMGISSWKPILRPQQENPNSFSAQMVWNPSQVINESMPVEGTKRVREKRTKENLEINNSSMRENVPGNNESTDALKSHNSKETVMENELGLRRHSGKDVINTTNNSLKLVEDNTTSSLSSNEQSNDISNKCETVESEQVLLEWHPQPGEEKPLVPLLKDVFPSERKKAQMLNFSFAYGKTPAGLAQDWKVSLKEAKDVKLWYKERQEVSKWQKLRKKEARDNGCVHTLLGRARLFPSVQSASYPKKGHIERAAISTPVQIFLKNRNQKNIGSVADVAMCAMLEISTNARLKELGWKQIMQIRDEVILEGPAESAEEAKAIVIESFWPPRVAHTCEISSWDSSWRQKG